MLATSPRGRAVNTSICLCPLKIITENKQIYIINYIVVNLGLTMLEELVSTS